jgi:hypothetical protein
LLQNCGVDFTPDSSSGSHLRAFSCVMAAGALLDTDDRSEHSDVHAGGVVELASDHAQRKNYKVVVACRQTAL